MLLRIRWFLAGLITAVGGGAYLVTKLVRMRERLTPSNLRRAAVAAAADVLAWTGRVVAPQSGEGTGH